MFLAGANSIFHGEKLLTTKNATVSHDEALFAKLGIRAENDAARNRPPAERHVLA